MHKAKDEKLKNNQTTHFGKNMIKIKQVVLRDPKTIAKQKYHPPRATSKASHL